MDHREVPRANGSATLSAFGWVRGPLAGTGMTVIGMRLSRAARLAVVGLDGNDHVELLGRVVRYYGANATSNLSSSIHVCN
jgi:hypothetical protein